MAIVISTSNSGTFVLSSVEDLVIERDSTGKTSARETYLRKVAYLRDESNYEELLQRLLEKVIDMKSSLLARDLAV
jgi:hypothetical protein